MNMQESLLNGLAKHLGFNSNYTQLRGVGGGSINHAFVAIFEGQEVFIKANERFLYPEMFALEIKGLDLLRSTKGFHVPKVLFTYQDTAWSMLALEYIPQGKPHADFAKQFALALLELHEITQEQFGLDHDNYIGNLKQHNRPHAKWSDFFLLERILPQLQRSRDGGKMNASSCRRVEAAAARVDALFPAHPPALLHGDLWSGNYMINANGSPVIIDPAVYFGHPFMDLGMMKLFGGFNPQIAAAYAEAKAWEDGWDDALELALLYPLLVHVNLFGGAYVQQVQEIANRFG